MEKRPAKQMERELISAELQQAAKVLQDFISDENNLDNIHKAALLISESFEQGGKLISCGNGGSMCDAMHLAEELSGKYRNDRPSLPAIAISDPGHLSCTANDYGFQNVFSRFVSGFGKKGDVLVAISTSGNSENVIEAAKTAKGKDMNVIALTGGSGGKLSTLCDVEIRVPHSGYADRTQEMHIKVIHILILLIEKNLCGKL